MAEINLLYVLRRMAVDFLADKKIKSTEFIGAVYHIIDASDDTYSNIDPFHDQLVDRERIYKGGKIKNKNKIKIAHVEIPDFFIKTNFHTQSRFIELESLTTLKINVTKMEGLEANTAVVVSFKDPGKYERPYIVKIIADKIADYHAPELKNGSPKDASNPSKGPDCSDLSLAENTPSYWQDLGKWGESKWDTTKKWFKSEGEWEEAKKDAAALPGGFVDDLGKTQLVTRFKRDFLSEGDK